MFRQLKLRGANLEKSLLSRLHDANDRLAEHVETLEVASDEVGLRVPWEKLVALRVLVWSSLVHIPPRIIDVLHARPDLQLHLIPGLSRPKNTTLDKSALSSPSLRTLDYTVHGQHSGVGKLPVSEFAAFKHCLVKASGLRSLTLHLKPGTVNEDYQSGELNLQLEAGDIFPALESLIFSNACYDSYSLNAKHCQMWVQCMDWSTLRHLDLGHSSPQYLLLALTGRIRKLVSLRFGFWPNYSGPRAPWASPADLDVVRFFLKSIDALQVLQLKTSNDAQCAQIRPSLLRKHGPSLRKLVVWLGMRQGWKLSHFEDLRKYTPNLVELDVPAELKQEKKPRGEFTIVAREVVSQVPGLRGLRQDLSRPSSRSVWPTKIQTALTAFQHLRRLTFRIQLNYDSTEFVPDARPGASCAINDESAQRRVLQLYNGLVAIETLVVVFRAPEPGVVEWTYKVQSKWVSEEARYRVIVEKSVEGEEWEARRRQEPFDPFG
ncbi:hypothetical protein IQ06DRAFT_338382 [Phaeosphaeriaceae sp. SRC1lsM3a]|nr:hypothetical protein IQ06DRAFT_338382 [Stagonospora sp. SRC1lsM3a]